MLAYSTLRTISTLIYSARLIVIKQNIRSLTSLANTIKINALFIWSHSTDRNLSFSCLNISKALGSYIWAINFRLYLANSLLWLLKRYTFSFKTWKSLSATSILTLIDTSFIYAFKRIIWTGYIIWTCICILIYLRWLA